MTTILRLSEQAASSIPWPTADEMREVDRAMVEDLEILLLQMMEHAGRHLAHLARERFLAGDARGRHVVVLAGKGGNGGGALVCARRLAGWGANVTVIPADDDQAFGAIPRHQLAIVRHLGLTIRRSSALAESTPDLIIDGIIGYSLRGDPKGEAAELIRRANQASAPKLALDVPSGLDATTGEPHVPTVEALATMALALPKSGLRSAAAERFVGELYLADIGVPPGLYDSSGLRLGRPQPFVRSDLVRLR